MKLNLQSNARSPEKIQFLLIWYQWMEIIQRCDRNRCKTNQILKPKAYESLVKFTIKKRKRTKHYLEHDNLPIISLQMEGPGGGNEALSGTDDVIAPAGEGIHYRDGLGAVGQGLQL